MRKFLLFLFCLLSACAAFPQADCSIQSAYPLFVGAKRIAYQDGFLLIKNVDSVRGKHCAGVAINTNLKYFQFLLNHYTEKEMDSVVLLAKDSVALQAGLVKGLRKAEVFDSLMTDYSRKVLSHTQAKDSIPEKIMLDFAVKYFSIRKITPDGYYAAKVCAGLNDIEATEPMRRPHLEAFCFAAIQTHYDGPRYSMLKEMTVAVKELYALNFGIDPSARLLRAQGALYLLMRQNPALKAMLWEEYKVRAAYLPFVLVP